MIKILIIVGFLLIRYIISVNAKKNSAAPRPKPKAPVSPESRPKTMDDIFGDFMKEINKEQTISHTKPVMQSSQKDFHKAEEDSHKKLDWQEVVRSKGDDSIGLADYKDIYRKPTKKIAAPKLQNIEVEVSEADNILENFDLKKALIYKEVLERKYFTI